MHHHNILLVELFIFTLHNIGHLILSPLIFSGFESEKLIKTLNPFTIIFLIQSLGRILIHQRTIIHYLENLYRILITIFINNLTINLKFNFGILNEFTIQ